MCKLITGELKESFKLELSSGLYLNLQNGTKKLLFDEYKPKQQQIMVTMLR